MRILKKIIKWIAVLALIGSLIILFLSSYRFSYGAFSNEPVGNENSRKIMIAVDEGETVDEIAEELVDRHVIRNAEQFLFRVRFSDYGKFIKPGEYEVSPAMGIDDILKKITQKEDIK